MYTSGLNRVQCGLCKEFGGGQWELYPRDTGDKVASYAGQGGVQLSGIWGDTQAVE